MQQKGKGKREKVREKIQVVLFAKEKNNENKMEKEND